jgi:hypothetical protein
MGGTAGWRGSYVGETYAYEDMYGEDMVMFWLDGNGR